MWPESWSSWSGADSGPGCHVAAASSPPALPSAVVLRVKGDSPQGSPSDALLRGGVSGGGLACGRPERPSAGHALGHGYGGRPPWAFMGLRERVPEVPFPPALGTDCPHPHMHSDRTPWAMGRPGAQELPAGVRGPGIGQCGRAGPTEAPCSCLHAPRRPPAPTCPPLGGGESSGKSSRLETPGPWVAPRRRGPRGSESVFKRGSRTRASGEMLAEPLRLTQLRPTRPGHDARLSACDSYDGSQIAAGRQGSRPGLAGREPGSP